VADVKADAKKEFFGQPVWVWGVAAAVMVAAGIYLYRRNAKAAAAGGAATAPAGTAASSGVGSLYGWMLNNQASPASPAPAPAPGGTASPLRQVTISARNRDLYRLARSYGMTESQFLKVNPGLKKYEGTGKAIPIGTTITVGGV
jgi:hypothetical protein